MEFINGNDLILLNSDEKCQGTYTWGRGNQKSAIDLVIVNENMYRYFVGMKIDDEKEKIDISDHNLIQVQIKVNTEKINFQKGVWEEYTYFKTDEETLKGYRGEVKNMLSRERINKMEKLDDIVEKAAKKTLQTKYRRKKIDGEQIIIEPEWINDKIREEIHKRKSLNRQKRQLIGEEQERVHQLYLEQKERTQEAVKEALWTHET